MRKGDATRERILEEAGRQAAIRGLTAVSLSDVAQAVGLSKSGLFKHFESKEDMLRAVLERTGERFQDLVYRPALALAPGRPRLEAIFDNWLEWCEVTNASSGCPLIAAAMELDDQPGPLRDYLQLRQTRFYDNILSEMHAMRSPPVPEAEALAAVFQMKSFILGYAESGRLLRDVNARAAASAAFRGLLDRTERLAA